MRVWDLFVRFFHWSLAASFVVAWLTRHGSEDIHHLAGYAAAAAVGVATTAVVAPLVTMVLVGFVAATYINYLDNKYDVKSRVIEALK